MAYNIINASNQDRNWTSMPLFSRNCSSIITSTTNIGKVNDYFLKNVYLPSLVFASLMFALGLPGNIIVFYVYWKKWKKTTCRIFILALTGFDLVNCILMPYEIASLRNIILFDYDVTCRLTRFLTFTMNSSSSFILLCIAVDRYMRICRPLHKYFSKTAAKRAVIISMALAVTSSLPALFIYGTFSSVIHLTLIPGDCVIGKLCYISNKYLKTKVPFIFGIFTLIGNVTIDTALIVFYFFIAKKVLNPSITEEVFRNKESSTSAYTDSNFAAGECGISKATSAIERITVSNSLTKSTKILNQAQKMNHEDNPDINTERNCRKSRLPSSDKRWNFIQRSPSTSSSENRRKTAYKTTLMLFLVTVIFILSFLPFCVIVLKRYTDPTYYGSLSDQGKAAYQLLLRFYLMSSALNPLIYSFLSSQFRIKCRYILKNLFCLKM